MSSSIRNPEHPIKLKAVGPVEIPLSFICGGICGVFVIPFLTSVSSIATAIIGALGLAGVLPCTVVSSILITSGCLTLASSITIVVIGHTRKEKSLWVAGIIASLVSLSFVAIGTLGHIHMLSTFPVGLTGIVSSIIVLGSASICYKKVYKRR